MIRIVEDQEVIAVVGNQVIVKDNQIIVEENRVDTEDKGVEVSNLVLISIKVEEEVIVAVDLSKIIPML